MTRIAQVALLDYRNPGGMEVHVMNLSKELISLGFEADIICLEPNPKMNLNFVPFSAFNAFDYDIIHTHGQYGRDNRALRRDRSKIVHTYHGTSLGLYWYARYHYALRHRYYYKAVLEEIEGGWFADKVIAVGSACAKEAHRCYLIPKHKIHFIPNGYFPRSLDEKKCIAWRNRLNIRSDEFVFLFVGRWGFHKAPWRAIEAVRELAKKFSKIKLLMVPGCPNGFSHGNIVSTGPLFFEEVGQLYSIVNALLSTSRYEGMPLCILEALSAGLPVIATAVPGTTDLIEHEKNGILVRRDCKDLGRAMERIYLDSRLRARLSKQAIVGVQDLSWSNIAKKTSELYDSLR